MSSFHFALHFFVLSNHSAHILESSKAYFSLALARQWQWQETGRFFVWSMFSSDSIITLINVPTTLPSDGGGDKYDDNRPRMKPGPTRQLMKAVKNSPRHFRLSWFVIPGRWWPSQLSSRIVCQQFNGCN